MPSLKEIIKTEYKNKTNKEAVTLHISMLFIKSKNEPHYVIINQIDWNYLKSISGIQQYLDINTHEKYIENGLMGTIWGIPIYLVNETEEIKVYHDTNDMKTEFPNNKTVDTYYRYSKNILNFCEKINEG